MSEVLPYVLVLLLALSIVQVRQMLLVRQNSAIAINAGNSDPVIGKLGKELKTSRIGLANWLAIVMLASFMGLRKTVGTDWNLYFLTFQNLDPNSDWPAQIASSSQEFGFTTLNLVIRFLTSDSVYLFMVLSFASVISIFWFLNAESENFVLSLSLYLFLGHYLSAFNISRQALAVALIALAISLIEKNKLSYGVLVAIAVSIHLTALIPGLIALAIFATKIRLKALIVFCLIASALSFVVLRIPALMELAASLSPRYSNYLATALASGVGSYIVTAYLAMLIAWACYLALKQKSENLWLKIALFSPIFLIIGTQVVEIGRIASYFTLGLLVALPNLIRQTKYAGALNLLLFALSAIFCLAYLYSFGDLLPYRS